MYTAGCRTSCRTRLTTGWMNSGCSFNTVVICQTGLTTGWMFVYTVVKPFVQPPWQPVVSCKRGIRFHSMSDDDGFWRSRAAWREEREFNVPYHWESLSQWVKKRQIDSIECGTFPGTGISIPKGCPSEQLQKENQVDTNSVSLGKWMKMCDVFVDIKNH